MEIAPEQIKLEASGCSNGIVSAIIKTEEVIESETDETELSPSDIEKEFEADFKTEDDKSICTDNGGVFENNTTVYHCQICRDVFGEFSDYKTHRKQHFIEKRRCHMCKMVCQSISKLEVHINRHLGLTPYKCNICDKGFTSKHQVKLHQRCHSTELRYKCDKCEKAFRNLGSLRSHALVHQEKIKEFICKICNQDCEALPALRKHMESHGKKSEIICGVCHKTFVSDRHLQIHLATHKDLQFPCEFCGKIYESMYRIKRHIKRAHIPNHCEECDEIFYDRTMFTKHKKEHAAAKALTCKFCNKSFDKAKNLSEHIRLQHKGDGSKHTCSICEKEFINASLLKNHIKTHDKCFKCTNCDKVFSSRYNLEIHSVTHTGARNHKCDICGKSYSTKSSLKNHKATHTETRTFQCTQCPKLFKTNRRLYVHKLSHRTEEKYECDICNAKFRVKQYLKYHQIKHSNEKPFGCDVCKKRFKHKKSYDKHMHLGRHKKTVEGGEEEDELECSFCDETFAKRGLLLDHFDEVHQKDGDARIDDTLLNDGDSDDMLMKMENQQIDNEVKSIKMEILGDSDVIVKNEPVV